MPQQNGLRPLQVRIPRQNHIVIASRQRRDFAEQRQQRLARFDNHPPHVQMHIRRNLIVTAAGRVQALARLTDALGEHAFDIHMDVFQCHGKGKRIRLDVRGDCLEPRDDLIPIFLG